MDQQPAGYGDCATVYILTQEWDHEGELILAVASTAEAVKALLPHQYPYASAMADQYNIWAAEVGTGEPELIETNWVRYDSGKHHHVLEGWRPA